jgi:hypothetical protein
VIESQPKPFAEVPRKRERAEREAPDLALRTSPVGERTERGKLIGEQLALVIAANEDFEHDPAVGVDEQNRCRQAAPMNGRSTKATAAQRS